MRSAFLALVGFVFGCGTECEPVACEKVDREARGGDVAIDLDTDTAFVFYSIDGFDADVGVTGGEIVFTTDAPSCSASSDNPCTITLERLRIELSSLTQPTNEGDVRLEHPVVSVVAPLELTDEGSGFALLPSRTRVQTCVSVDGRSDSTLVPLEKPLNMNLDFENEGASLSGTLPIRFGIGENECKQQQATGTILASGKTPWERP
jgi:hypothetical protein